MKRPTRKKIVEFRYLLEPAPKHGIGSTVRVRCLWIFSPERLAVHGMSKIKGVMTLIRTDNDTVIEWRVATPEERQVDMYWTFYGPFGDDLSGHVKGPSKKKGRARARKKKAARKR